MKKSFLPIVFWAIFLLGCTTSEGMLDREPVVTEEAIFSKADFRDCAVRWADNPRLKQQYHPDGVWIRDALGGPIALIAQIDGEIRLYHHWNAPLQKKHLVFLTEACSRDVSLRPPNNFWNATPRLREES